jgi:hypothetical protein
MRHLFLFTVLLTLLTSFNEAISQSQNIGLNLSINDISGLNAELRYERLIGPRWILGTGVASNFVYGSSLNLGFRYFLLKKEKISIITGLDYRFVSLRGLYDDKNKREFYNRLELPFEFRYRISKNTSLNMGVTIPYSLDKGRYEDNFINSYRLGVIRHF